MAENDAALDCRGLPCPQPVLKTREALDASVSPFCVIVDNDGARANVRRFAEGQGARVSVEEAGGDYHLTITPGKAEGTLDERSPVRCRCSDVGLVVYVASEAMGSGDDQLGTKLMGAFLDTLGHFKDTPSHIIFINGGARLTADGSHVLDQIRHLEQLGATVLTCGTCLDHFGIREKLAVGRISNMYAIIETLSKAERVVRP